MVAGYDMAMDSETHDRFLDRGILPHSKVPRTKGGRPASVNLGPHELTRTDGSHTTMVVTAVDGAHCHTITDGTGADWYVPLTLKKIIRRLSGNRTLFYKEMEVPDSELAPEELVGATTSVVLNSKPEEIEARPHRRRTRSSRAWAEDTCEQARKFDGLRQDSESNISTYKRSKPLDRSRSTSAAGLQLDLLAYQHNTAITAVVAHHDHTGADVSKWFGQYKPLDPYDLVRNLDPRQLAHTLDPKRADQHPRSPQADQQPRPRKAETRQTPTRRTQTRQTQTQSRLAPTETTSRTPHRHARKQPKQRSRNTLDRSQQHRNSPTRRKLVPQPPPAPCYRSFRVISRQKSRQPAHVAQSGQSRDLLSPRSQVRILPWALPGVLSSYSMVPSGPYIPSVATVSVSSGW